MSSIRLGLGLLLAATAGLVLGYGWADGDTVESTLGVLALLLGVLTVMSELVRPRRADQRPEQLPEGDDLGAPLLGEMLLSYGLIRRADLERALEVHDKTGKRLGRVLVEMKLVTSAQIAEVLEEQLSRRGLAPIEDGERVGVGRPDADALSYPRVAWQGYREEPSGRDGR
ncbi:MAG: hypothetical protein MUQ26_01280 [Armatimonadetes bacterium]|nr:hypothetical protein [Armatimonadota bacterium]